MKIFGIGDIADDQFIFGSGQFRMRLGGITEIFGIPLAIGTMINSSRFRKGTEWWAAVIAAILAEINDN